MAEYEAKRKKMLDEYNQQISHRVDQLPITKISYRIKDNGFSEWLEVHALASKSKAMLIDLLLQSLKAKFEWVLTQAKKLGVLPPLELSTFRILVDDMKRKRSSEILQEVFVKENIVVDGMERNLIPPQGIKGSRGRVIREPESGIFYFNGTPEAEEMFKKIELTIEARDDVNQARKIIQDNLDGLGQDMRVRGGNTLTILLPFEEEQVELKLFSKLGFARKLNKALRRDKRLFELKPGGQTLVPQFFLSSQGFDQFPIKHEVTRCVTLANLVSKGGYRGACKLPWLDIRVKVMEGDDYVARANTLKDSVKTMIRIAGNLLRTLELVDELQRLGIFIRGGASPTLIELAKLDFDMVQAIHLEDLKHASSWDTKLTFARDLLVENFLWTVGFSYLPHFNRGRRTITKVAAIITTLDDVYDVFGTLDELEKFTDVINRWDIKAIEQLPGLHEDMFLWTLQLDK
ncbi:R-linalool synthase QH1, chloroplastic-like protein [Tanacetum coccineum]